MDDSQESNDFSLDKRVGENHKLICSSCKRQTNHTVLKSVTNDWGNENIQGSSDYLIVQCLGCEGVSYCTLSADSEDRGYGGQPIVTTEQFPKANIKHIAIILPDYTPRPIRATYRETSEALSAGLTMLGAIGTRTIIELICKSEDATGGNLDSMIDSLRDKGTISPNAADTIHGVRLFGNDAVHENRVKRDELDAAWQTINMIINYIYGSRDSEEILLNRQRAEKLQRSRANRSSNKKKEP